MRSPIGQGGQQFHLLRVEQRRRLSDLWCQDTQANLMRQGLGSIGYCSNLRHADRPEATSA